MKNITTGRPGSLTEKAKRWFGEYGRNVFWLTLFGAAVYFTLLSQDLYNSFDGLWEFSNYQAGEWERSIGRWFWPYIDRLRFGVVSYALNSMITLFLDSLALTLLADLFEIREKKTAFLLGAFFIVSPVTCDVLSYSFMSPTFGTAFLLSVLSAYCILRAARLGTAVLGGGMLLACSMGSYQAYIGVLCAVLLFFVMKEVLRGAQLKTAGALVQRSVLGVAAGGVLYKLVTVLVSRIYQVPLDDYKGANDVTVWNMIVKLPERLGQAYADFYGYFCTDRLQRLIFGSDLAYGAVLVLIFVFAGYMLLVWGKKNPRSALLFALLFAAVPAVCNVTLLIATEAGTVLLMAGAMALVPALFLALFYHTCRKRLLYQVYAVVLCAALWINVCIVNNDQTAMREGRTGVTTLTQNILSRLMDEGYLDEGNQWFAFVGTPAENRLFKKSSAWEMANDYAAFGRWLVDPNCNRHSWEGMVTERCGVFLNLCESAKYEEILAGGEVEEMPIFPKDGCIKIINDVIVVKVSENYK